PRTAPAADVPQPQLSPTGQRMAAALAQRPSISIPPDVAAFVSKSFDSPNPQIRAQGLAIYQQYARPSEFGFQTLPDGTIIRTDPRSGTVQQIYQAATKPTFGVVGETADGGKQYGFIDPTKRSVQPYNAPDNDTPRTVMGPNGQPIAIPPGVDPKTFRNEVSK